MNKELIVIGGPTGVGKTEIAIALASRLKTEIISADSRQIYKEMSIGTAVPDKQQLASVVHHFIQNKSIHEYYNASKYEVEVLELLNSLFTRYDKVIMVGGSGLYIDAVIKGIDDLPDYNPKIREQLKNRIESEGLGKMQKELEILDPESFAKIDLQNPKRLQKALEICLTTGKPYSEFLKRTPKKRDFSIKTLALNTDRTELYDRINQRVLNMIENNLVEEARTLLKYKELNPLNTVGYKEIFSYLENEISLERAIELIQNNSRKYARKQITWFRKNNQYKWFHPSEIDDMIRYIEDE